LSHLKSILYAAVFTAAFFLRAETPISTYIEGRVDAVDLSLKDQFEPFIIDVNHSLSSNLLIATGVKGRMETVINNKYWRLGSETMGIWNSDSDFWLDSGSILLCTEHPQIIKFSTRDSNATLNGRGTVIIEATKNGGFKFIPLEGKGTISTENGGSKEIIGGRMILVLGKPAYFGDAYDIDIMLMLKSSRLINAFPTPLPTFKKIGLAIYVQELKLKGKYDALIGDATTNENLQIWKFGKAKDTNPKQSTPKKGFLGRFFGSD
jgi:hypothetical protein|tara:strand:+ start:2792 stop:3583 length:792 start_codon:yes stop_codon:yes gene_type:complete